LAARGRAAERRDEPMREDLRPGKRFPDLELANEDEQVVQLSRLMRGFPAAVVFSRGYF
jgi:peroxiredoxin